MSQLEINNVLAQIRAMSAQVQKPQSPQATGGIAAVDPAGNAAAGPRESGFGNVLRNGIERVNEAQQKASQMASSFERGVPGVELPQVMLEMQKASVAFRAATEVRNRMVSAYQEIMNMPI